MRFEEAYHGWQARRLTQEAAGRLLGVGERTFRRYVDRYEDEGMEGMRDKRLTQASARKAPGAEVQDVVARYRARHQGWKGKHSTRGIRAMSAHAATRG
ncbi:MAG: helix-turn-helix domain-containing protein [Deferrisomatales bacterium]|nr:helix-turn-helix domain-containing protein [Deferrisomatales bacterium]